MKPFNSPHPLSVTRHTQGRYSAPHARSQSAILTSLLALPALLLALPTLLAPTAAAQDDDPFADVTIETVPVAGNVSMLVGRGGNIGVSAGTDGVLIIDDQFAPLAGRIKEAIAALGDTDQPQFVLNTHFHGDHVGGNSEFGADSLIVAHENVRLRMQNGDAPAVALPVVTYDDDVTIHFNGEEITLIHLPTGHTDTDSVVLFAESKVIHMGDHYFNGGFPFIDLNSGGTLPGFLSNVEKALSWIDDDTAIIPGHGPLATKADMTNYYQVVRDTADAILAMKAAGMTVAEAVEAGLDAQYESWGQGFISEQRWIETIYDAADQAEQ